MSSFDPRALPLDKTSESRLRQAGLTYRLVDTSDADWFGTWLRSDARGFHDVDPEDAVLADTRAALAYRRTTEVVDPTSSTPDAAIATVSSWPAELTVSPGRLVEAWAISAVTVSPTHSGRGVARALLESELRTAAAAGLPLAALTVSESTLYGRYGFAPAAMTADWRIRTARAKWTGPIPDGIVELISRHEWRDQIDDLYERVRLQNPGHIDAWARRFDQKAGLTGESPEHESRRLRAARYLDETGEVRGLMLYRVSAADDAEFTDHKLTVDSLITETDDAETALWRLALTTPLVSEVIAPLRRLDEPVRWQIADWRAALVSPRDNLWLRILDVPATLTSRRYDSPGAVTLQVSDPLGHAEGTWILGVGSDGRATVEPASGADAATISLDIATLSAIFLGAVSVDTLARAGRITGDAESIRRADALFHTATEPWLPFWF
ncbi:GNAT family N-acetyltransferase [Herbiconiux sp. L3-i23]|uniref:GNAT family N-acetyltransferase n=1 Tax=Herbiconiux sp. L3-i23 TaxID=2905871 RepID=UPI00206DD53D|nr:GNAT family N-acetyltransferase [Herbiconiux sp. L3-i23]BDI23787.1 UPF0256 protein [Herbiconiux sp. L3-i23]